MKSKNTQLDFLVEQLAPLGEITSRRMFGGHCLYCEGTVFALVSNNVLYLKADAANRPEFEEAGSKPFRPRTHPGVSMSYYEAPAEIFEDPVALKRWAGGAVAAGRRSKKPPRKAK